MNFSCIRSSCLFTFCSTVVSKKQNCIQINWCRLLLKYWRIWVDYIMQYIFNFLYLLIFFKHCKESQIFYFLNILKRWSFQKDCTGIWSFLYYQERRYFFFPKIWSYSLDRKCKMIFLKKIHGNMIFSPNFLKRWSFQKNCTGIWSFLYFLEIWYSFFNRKYDIFFWTENERLSFSRNTWKYDIFSIYVHMLQIR